MIVIEFSLAQRSFHKQSMEDMLERNVNNIIRRIQTDYIPIGIFPNDDRADEFIKRTKTTMKNYQMYRDVNGEVVVIA